MTRFYHPRARGLAVLLAAAATTPACDEGPEAEYEPVLAEEQEEADEEVKNLATTDVPSATSAVNKMLGFGAMTEPTYLQSGWTAYTSEEYPPVVCDPGSVVTGFGCNGAYCDNVRLHCSPSGVGAYATGWSSYFSEEGMNYAICPFDAWVTGISCNGSRCDNISIQCTSTQPGPIKTPPKVPPQCQWSPWISEENGGTLWLNTYGNVRGVQCSGSRCDNKRFYLCNL